MDRLPPRISGLLKNKQHKCKEVNTVFPSPIQTLLSALEFHQIHRVFNENTGHGLKSEYRFITAGWEFHPTPKANRMA